MVSIVKSLDTGNPHYGKSGHIV